MYFTEIQKSNSARLWIPAIVLSLVFHVMALVSEFNPFRPTHEADNSENTPIEISQVPPEYMNPPPQVQPQQAPRPRVKSKELEMAESDDAKNRKLDPNAKYLSDKTQTAEEQMKAKAIDDFRNKQGTGAKTAEKDKTLGAIPPTGEETAEESKTSDLEIADNQGANPSDKQKGAKRDWKTLSLKDLGVGGDGGLAAATDDRLDGVREGERTILSTREYRYFSYYHRIKELLRQYWKPSVEQRIYKMYEKGKNLSDEEMVTRVLVLLTPEGRIEKISRVTSSGITEVDDAAVEAFQKAGPFPNPPKGMLDEDGFVRIRWDFILKAESGPRIQFSSAGKRGNNAP